MTAAIPPTTMNSTRSSTRSMRRLVRSLFGGITGLFDEVEHFGQPAETFLRCSSEHLID